MVGQYGQDVGRTEVLEVEVEAVEGEGPRPAPQVWWVLQWLTLALALAGGGVLAAPEHLFGSSGDGQGGFEQFGLVLMVLTGSALVAMAGVLVGLWAFGRGTPFSSLRLGFGLDVGILALVLGLVILT